MQILSSMVIEIVAWESDIIESYRLRREIAAHAMSITMSVYCVREPMTRSDRAIPFVFDNGANLFTAFVLVRLDSAMAF